MLEAVTVTRKFFTIFLRTSENPVPEEFSHFFATFSGKFILANWQLARWEGLTYRLIV